MSVSTEQRVVGGAQHSAFHRRAARQRGTPPPPAGLEGPWEGMLWAPAMTDRETQGAHPRIPVPKRARER